VDREEYHHDEESTRADSGGRNERMLVVLKIRDSISIGRLLGGKREMVDSRDLARSSAIEDWRLSELGMEAAMFLSVKEHAV
jgi:hypothetical protein